jgi:thioredoxin
MVNYLSTKAEFDEAISSGTVIVDFTASWCPPCKMIGPKFEALASSYPTIKFVKVDVDQNSEAAEFANVQAMPTFKVYKDGVEVGELVGTSEDKLKELLEKHK